MYEQQLQAWLKDFILDLNLCPFAHEPAQNQRIKTVICEEKAEEVLVKKLFKELESLSTTPSQTIETTLLGIPHQLQDFDDFWSFMEWSSELLANNGLASVFQLVGFHPDYIFADTEPTDQANFTNRSPFPVIHILRQNSVEKATETHPNIDTIPSENITNLRQISRQQLEQLAYQR